jgi:hypothetical protein
VGISAAGGAASAGGAAAGASAAGGAGGAAVGSSGGAGTNLHKNIRQTVLPKKLQANLRSNIQPNLARRSTHNIRPIRALRGRLTLLRVVRYLLRVRRIHYHDLAFLTMRARGTVQEHGLRASHWHIERANISLAVLEGNVAGVHAAIHRFARAVGSRLRNSVVAIGELELDDVADSRVDGVGDEGVLWATDDDGDDLVLATVGTGFDGWPSGGEFVVVVGGGGLGKGEGEAAEEQGACDEGLHIQIDV